MVARTSAFAFKGRDVDVREVGRRLNVGTVLEGSVRRAGDRLRVTAQLIDATDGYHLWSSTYERRLADVFVLQEELAQAIAGSLPLPAGARPASLVRPSTATTEAYTLYLKGRFFALKRTIAGLAAGIECFEQALALDPGYALARAGLAESWALRGFEEFGDLPPLIAMPRAQVALRRALELDPALAEGHCWSGVVSFLFDWDWGAAERSLRRAIELRPDYSLAHTWYAVYLLARGRHEEAVVRSEHAAELDPLAFSIQTVTGLCHHFAGRFEEAIARYRATLELDPGNLRSFVWIGAGLSGERPARAGAAHDGAGDRTLRQASGPARRARDGSRRPGRPGGGLGDSARAAGDSAPELRVTDVGGGDSPGARGGGAGPRLLRAPGGRALGTGSVSRRRSELGRVPLPELVPGVPQPDRRELRRVPAAGTAGAHVTRAPPVAPAPAPRPAIRGWRPWSRRSSWS